MLEVSYTKLVPYPFDTVLSQYFDYEHIAHVHPDTLGEYRVIEADGNRLVYEQIWQRNWRGKRPKSVVVQNFLPPNEIWFEFTEGLHKGTKVHTLLSEHTEGTVVEETYHVPLPNWAWLRPLLRPFMLRTIEKVWEEDLQVEVCYGGYPGIPNREVQPSGVCPPALLTTPHVLGRATDFPPQRLHRIHLEDTEVVLFYYQGHYVALEGICPHSGGILSLGRVEQNCLICPWHGAKFDVITGENLCKTAHRPLQTYQVREEEGVLNLYPVVNIESAESE